MENIWATKTLSYKQTFSINLTAIEHRHDIIEDSIDIVALHGNVTFDKDTKQLKANFLDVPNALIDAIVASNEIRKENIANSILSRMPKTIGIYRLIMKTGSDNFRSSAIEGVIAKLKDAKVEIVIYEPVLNEDIFEGFRVIKDIEEFKNISDVIVANRVEDSIKDLKEKVYTRDIFGSDK